jgi:hypothetical protein
MRFAWRNQDPFNVSQQWLAQIATKDYVEGRSALSLARAWSGPVALAGVMALQPSLRGFAIETGSVEAQTRFDTYSGPRNHDLLLVGTATGGRTVVSVEAKADETLGQSIAQYRKAAEKRRLEGEATDAPERLQTLLAAFASHLDPSEAEVGSLRYQLFGGIAGAVAAAVDAKASMAVFLVHEFITDETDADKRKSNEQDLARFMKLVFSHECADAPWCVGPLAFAGNKRLTPAIELYVAKTTTDLWFDAS